MRRVFSLVAVCLALLIVPNGLQSQPSRDSGGKGKGNKGERGPKGQRGPRGGKGYEVLGGVGDRAGLNLMGGDPSLIFDYISKGQDVINRAELQDDGQRQMFDRIAQGMQITNGQITREQFKMAIEAATGRFSIPGVENGMGFGMNRNSDQFAEDFFRTADKNNDGVLDETEMSDRLKQDYTQFDKNKDGRIDLNEYREFFRAIMPQGTNTDNPFSSLQRSGQPGRIQVVPQSDDIDSRPQVFRYGRLPMDLPNWFEQLDIDRDGQIGLYEWVSPGGRTPDEFKMWDRNGDGYLTAEEVLSFVRNLNQSSDPNAIASAGMGNQGGRGGPGGFGRGQGGFGGGQGGFGGGRGGGNGQPMMMMIPGMGGQGMGMLMDWANSQNGRNQGGMPGMNGRGGGRDNNNNQGGGRGRGGRGGRGGGGDD